MSGTFSNLDEMMESYAREAVLLAKSKYSIALDYSEDSVEHLEQMLSSEFDTIMRAFGESAAGDKGPHATLEESAKIWGGYLGEVIRRRWGGGWSFGPYPNSEAWILSLTAEGGQRIFPVLKVHRRLTEGASDNVWSFYQMVRMKLEASRPPAH